MRKFFLETERLGFSHWEEGDLPLARQLWGEAEVTRYICASGVFSPGEIEARLRTEIDNNKKYGVQYFPVFEKATEELVGCCGLRPCDKKDALELGVHLRKEFWRQGFGREAVEAVIEYAFTLPGVEELRAGHNPQNTASRRLLTKVGFQYERDEFYSPTGLYHPSYSMKKK